MTKDEALRIALDALENITSVSICEATHHAKKDRHLLCEECPNEVRHLKAITAIKAALEAKDEPAAWMYPDDLKRFETSETFAQAYSIEVVSPTHGETVPLYTTPPQRKPLTDEEMQRIIHEHTKLNPNQRDDKELIGYIINATRAIEAAHGIKGEA
jgi:hypothetical protein